MVKGFARCIKLGCKYTLFIKGKSLPNLITSSGSNLRFPWLLGGPIFSSKHAFRSHLMVEQLKQGSDEINTRQDMVKMRMVEGKQDQQVN